MKIVFAQQTAWNLEMSPLGRCVYDVVFVSVCVEVASSSWNASDCFLCLNGFDSSVRADKKINDRNCKCSTCGNSVNPTIGLGLSLRKEQCSYSLDHYTLVHVELTFYHLELKLPTKIHVT